MEILFVLLFVIFLIIYVNKDKVEKFLPIYGLLTGANDRLYRLLSVVSNLLKLANIPFSITGLLLLSAVEKERLVRGQSEGLILIPKESVQKLLSLSDELNQLGLGFTDIKDGGFRISSAVSLPVVTDTSIIILPVELAGHKWITSTRFAGYQEWYDENDLFPTKSYKLGNLDIPGPANPIDYLQRNFWSIGLRSNNYAKKGWFKLSPEYYGSNYVPYISQVDYVNGIRLDPRPIDGKSTVILGNGRTAIIPHVGLARRFPKVGRWRRYLWA